MTSTKLNILIFKKVDEKFLKAFNHALEGQDVTKFFAVQDSSAPAGNNTAASWAK